jgi:hypothetical protein
MYVDLLNKMGVSFLEFSEVLEEIVSINETESDRILDMYPNLVARITPSMHDFVEGTSTTKKILNVQDNIKKANLTGAQNVQKFDDSAQDIDLKSGQSSMTMESIQQIIKNYLLKENKSK